MRGLVKPLKRCGKHPFYKIILLDTDLSQAASFIVVGDFA